MKTKEQELASALINLYKEYLESLDEYNEHIRSPIEDWKEPSFDSFMVWIYKDYLKGEAQ